MASGAERRAGRLGRKNNPPVRLAPDSPLYTKGPLALAEEITSNGVCTVFGTSYKDISGLTVDILRRVESQFQASGIRTLPDQKFIPDLRDAPSANLKRRSSCLCRTL